MTRDLVDNMVRLPILVGIELEEGIFLNTDTLPPRFDEMFGKAGKLAPVLLRVQVGIVLNPGLDSHPVFGAVFRVFVEVYVLVDEVTPQFVNRLPDRVAE